MVQQCDYIWHMFKLKFQCILILLNKYRAFKHFRVLFYQCKVNSFSNYWFGFFLLHFINLPGSRFHSLYLIHCFAYTMTCGDNELWSKSKMKGSNSGNWNLKFIEYLIQTLKSLNVWYLFQRISMQWNLNLHIIMSQQSHYWNIVSWGSLFVFYMNLFKEFMNETLYVKECAQVLF